MDYNKYRMNACVDWIGIGIQTASTTKGHIVSKLTADALGFTDDKWPSVTVLDEGPGGAATQFEIRLQEPKCWKDVEIALRRLSKNFDRELASAPHVTAIEIAFDVYSKCATRDEMVDITAHLYTGLARFTSDNRRLYREFGKPVTALIGLPRKRLLEKLDEGWTIYIGNKFDDRSQRIYFKTKDKSGKVELEESERRARIELVLRGQAMPSDIASMRFEQYATYEKGGEEGKLAPFFSWSRYRSIPSDQLGKAIRAAKTQHGERCNKPRMGYRSGRMVRIGGVRVKGVGQVADRTLNKRARQALTDLSKRWERERAY